MGAKRIRDIVLIPHETTVMETWHMSFQKMNHATEWANLTDKYERILRGEPSNRWDGFITDQHLRQALGPYKLKCFAERARRTPLGTWGVLDPLDALRLYLVNKHHWHLNHVRAIEEEDDFLFLLRDELEQMKLNPEEAAPVLDAVAYRDSKLDFVRHFAQDAP